MLETPGYTKEKIAARIAAEQAAQGCTQGDNPSLLPPSIPPAPLTTNDVDAICIDGVSQQQQQQPPNPTKTEEPASRAKGAQKVADWKAYMAKPVSSLKRQQLSAVLALGCGEERLAVVNANSAKAITLAITSHRLPEGVFIFLPGGHPRDLVPPRVSRITGEWQVDNRHWTKSWKFPPCLSSQMCGLPTQRNS